MIRGILRVRSSLLIAAASSILLLAVAWAQLGEGTKSPDFRLQSLDGKMLTLAQIRKDPARPGANRVVILDFWATWCDPCKEELPIFQKLHQKYGKKGLVVVGLSVDRGGIRDVKPFVKQRKLTYTMLVDPKGTVKSAYRVRFLPTTFIIDKKGFIRAVHIGYTPEVGAQLEHDIKPLLK